LNTSLWYRRTVFLALLSIVFAVIGPVGQSWGQGATPELITFKSGDLELKGFIWKPEGRGPFPAILWNHGSEKKPGTVPTVAQYFDSRVSVLFVPHGRCQGLSPGPYIMDQLHAAVSQMQRSQMLVALHEAQ